MTTPPPPPAKRRREARLRSVVGAGTGGGAGVAWRVVGVSSRVVWSALRVGVAAVALVATAALAALALLPQLGLSSVIVTGGSMRPTFDTGALLIIDQVDPTEIIAGDVITYSGYTASTLTTHRVLRPVTVSGRLHFRTQGDANELPDPDLAPAEGLAGRAMISIPHAGRALAAMHDPTVRLYLLGAPAAVLCFKYSRQMWRGLSPSHHRKPSPGERAHAPAAGFRRPWRGVGRARIVGRSTAVVAVAVIAVTLAMALDRVGTSNAAFTHLVNITDNTFTTGTWS